MESNIHLMSQGIDTQVYYAGSIADADLIMNDGNSLEGKGWVPDEVVLPSGRDLAEGRDPAMPRAAQLAGLNMDAAEAGKLFPLKWKKMLARIIQRTPNKD
jgi:hypothetical protein